MNAFKVGQALSCIAGGDVYFVKVITALYPVESSQFGYALNNGTVGVYKQNNRLWRIKVILPHLHHFTCSDGKQGMLSHCFLLSYAYFEFHLEVYFCIG